MISAALALARGLQTGGTLCALGTVFAATMGAGGSPSHQRRILWISVLVAWFAAPFWLVLQAGEMAGTTELGASLRVAPLALYGSGFGRALGLRLLLLAAAGWLGARRQPVAKSLALVAGAFACLLQVKMGHAAAPEEPAQPIMAGLHVLGAAVWIGGLPSLLVGLDLDAAKAAHRFSLIGLGAVLVITVTALVQCIDLAGGLPGLLGTAYGHAVLLKAALFTVLLCFAGMNRQILTPGLAQPGGVARLGWSVRIEAAIGLGTVMVAAWLAAQAPGAHDRPIWPLPWRPSLDAFDDDVLASRLHQVLLLLVAGVVLTAAAVCWPRLAVRLRICGITIGVIGVALALPALRVLLVPAYPTSYYESPTGFTRNSVAAGAALYPQHCAGCHGARGFGDGPLAIVLPLRPLPLTGFHLLERSDGEMFWLLFEGVRARNGAVAMPGFASGLSEEQMWDLIDYVRTLAGAEPDANAAPLHHH